MSEPIFPVTRCKRYIKNIANDSDHSKNQDDLDNQPSHLKVTTEACVYISAVLVYIIAEILESAGNGADHSDEKRIFPKNIQMAIRGDQELAELLRSLITKAKNFPDELPSITNLNITNKEEILL